jgi:COP9 signalosome complex subunit 6
MNSFELLFTCIGDDVIIDRDYYNTKEEQFKQVFSEMDFLGWYTTGSMPNERDIKVHKQICEINESPVVLKLDPRPKSTDVIVEKIFIFFFFYIFYNGILIIVIIFSNCLYPYMNQL